MARHSTPVQRALCLAAGLAVGLAALGLPAAPAHSQDRAQSCTVSSAWFKPDAPEPDPNLPRDTNCAFHQWSVQEYLYLIQPGPDGLARFLGMASPHALFLYQGDRPAPYPGSAATRYRLGAGAARLQSAGNDAQGRIVFLPRVPKTADTTFSGTTQAGSNAVLVDQKGQWVYYTAQVNKVYYDWVVSKGLYKLAAVLSAPAADTFPNGTIEVKSSWRIAAKDGTTYIPDAAKSFYTIQALLCTDASCKTPVRALMALVGFHVVGRVEGHPEMIWATFEHKDNAPTCRSTPNPRTDYSFYHANQNCGNDPFWEKCNQIPTDTTTPNQICMAHPFGEPGDKPENTPNIQSLDAGLGQGLPAGSVWRNYRYAGAVWTTGNVGPNGLIVLDAASIRGSKKLANTSLESYTQEQNCLHCHTYQPIQMGNCFPRRSDSSGWKNLYVSHLFGLLCPQAAH